MNLPPDFHFSQASLRDFLACPRRFLLRHIQRLAWPAIEYASDEWAIRTPELGMPNALRVSAIAGGLFVQRCSLALGTRFLLPFAAVALVVAGVAAGLLDRRVRQGELGDGVPGAPGVR